MSADDAITTLAMRVEELAREVDGLREQHDQDRQDVAAARTAVAQWNARLTTEGIGPALAMRRDIKKLREDLDQLRAEAAGLSSAVKSAVDGGKTKAPQGPRWDNLDQDQEAAQLARLRDWVNGILRVQYPGYKLPDCWPAHREALWELGGLHAEWQRVFSDPRGASLKACCGSTNGGYPEPSAASARRSRTRPHTETAAPTATTPPGEGLRTGDRQQDQTRLLTSNETRHLDHARPGVVEALALADVLSDPRLRAAGLLTWASLCSSGHPDGMLSRLTLRIRRAVVSPGLPSTMARPGLWRLRVRNGTDPQGPAARGRARVYRPPAVGWPARRPTRPVRFRYARVRLRALSSWPGAVIT
jgi:hypothetical protein